MLSAPNCNHIPKQTTGGFPRFREPAATCRICSSSPRGLAFTPGSARLPRQSRVNLVFVPYAKCNKAWFTGQNGDLRGGRGRAFPFLDALAVRKLSALSSNFNLLT